MNIRISAVLVFAVVMLTGCGGGGGSPTPIPLPVSNAGVMQNVAVGTPVTLDGSASTAPNNGPLTYNWTLAKTPNGSTAALSDATAVKPKFVVDMEGTYVAALIVNDGTVNSKASTVSINAAVGNSAPVANAGPEQHVTTKSTVTLNGGASTDADNEQLTYNWTLTSVPTGSVAVLTGATTVNPTFVADSAGVYVATLVVRDSLVNSTAATVVITAVVGNAAPVANAGAPQGVTAGALVTLNGSGSTDANSGDILSYSWTLTTKPAGSTAALSGTNTAYPTFTANLVGTYVATLIVNDGKVNSAAATVTVTASELNLAPIANAGVALNVFVGTRYTLDGRASRDPNAGDTISYKWKVTSSGAAYLISGDTTATPTFEASLPGVHMVTLTVSDGLLNSTATVQITATLPVFVTQGGLTWMPVETYDNPTSASNWCTITMINGLYGWRFPTRTELSALYASGAMNGKGWQLGNTWSSTAIASGDGLYVVNLATGLVSPIDFGVITYDPTPYFACVH